jgi:hypothetical protein
MIEVENLSKRYGAVPAAVTLAIGFVRLRRREVRSS